jgi:hypothetical protein
VKHGQILYAFGGEYEMVSFTKQNLASLHRPWLDKKLHRVQVGGDFPARYRLFQDLKKTVGGLRGINPDFFVYKF